MARNFSGFIRGNGLRAQLLRGGIGVGALKIASIPLTLLTSIVLARGLGPEGYGQYTFIMAVIALVALPIGPGLGQLVTREVARFHHGEQWSLFRGLLHRARQWVMLVSAIIIGLLLIMAARVATWTLDDRWTLLIIASFMLPLIGLNSLRVSTLRGLRRVAQAQLPELLIRPGFLLLAAGTLVTSGLLNPATALASQMLAIAAALALGTWLVGRFRPKPVGQVDASFRTGYWARAIAPFTLLAAAGMLNVQLGILVLGWLGTDTDVAALKIAQMGSMIVALSLTVNNLVIGPHIARAYKGGDSKGVERLCRYSARISFLFALPVVLVLILLGEPLVALIYGEEYSESVRWPLAVLSFGQLLNVAFGSVGLLLVMSGYELDSLAGHAFAIFINIAVAMILVPTLGAVGAAISTVLGLLSWNLILSLRVSVRLKIRASIL